MTTLSESLRRFAERAVGQLDAVELISEGDTGGRVWRVAFGKGDVAYLKASPDQRKWRQEVDAYETWLSRVEDGATSEEGTCCEARDRAPKLIAAEAGAESALLITALPGRPMDGLSLSVDAKREAYRQAGAFLRAWHHRPHADSDPVPLEDAVQRRMATWRKRAAPIVDEATLRGFDRRFAAGPALTGPRVPCHRDFRPRNWLLEQPGSSGLRLRVIDFEHARADAWLVDLVRLETGRSRDGAALRNSFFAGYGRGLTDVEEAQLSRLVALDELATLAWRRGPA